MLIRLCSDLYLLSGDLMVISYTLLDLDIILVPLTDTSCPSTLNSHHVGVCCNLCKIIAR